MRDHRVDLPSHASPKRSPRRCRSTLPHLPSTTEDSPLKKTTTRTGRNMTRHPRHWLATQAIHTLSSQERLRTYLASMDSLQACFTDCTGPEPTGTIVKVKGSQDADPARFSPLSRRGRRSAASAAHP